MQYRASLKTTRMQDVVTDIGANGKLKLYDAGAVLLAVFNLATVAGVVTGSTLAFSDANGGLAGILNTLAVANGTAVSATVTKADDTVVISAITVGTSAAELILDSVSLVTNQPVTIGTATITHA